MRFVLTLRNAIPSVVAVLAVTGFQETIPNALLDKCISKSQEEIKHRSAKTNDNLVSNIMITEFLWKQEASDMLGLMDRLNIPSLSRWSGCS